MNNIHFGSTDNNILSKICEKEKIYVGKKNEDGKNI
jgi:hypothetical protein